ncbi:toxin [Enterococcus sp. LJL128]
MNDYEKLLEKVSIEVPVIECDLSHHPDKAYYYRNAIFIDKSLPTTLKRQYLFEEFSHFKSSVGEILDQSCLGNSKQEKLARNIGYTEAISLDDLIDCYKKGIKYYWECAEYLDFTEDFIYEAVSYLRSKLGEIIYYKNYIIRFVTETLLDVQKKIS